MKKSTSAIIRALIVLLAIAAFVFMIRMPLYEGRNVDATLSQVYFHDPFLAYAYASSILFFVGLYHIAKLVQYAALPSVALDSRLRSARIVRNCALALMGLIAAPLAYLFIVRPEDDIAGGVAMGLFIFLSSSIVAFTANRYAKRLK